jgi:hypothetical protein
MLNGSRDRWEVVLNIHMMQSTTKDVKEAITTTLVVEEEQ